MITNEERTNPEITKKVESFLLDTLTNNPNEVYSLKDLEQLIVSNFQNQYQGVNVNPHVAWALDMLHANQMIKRVGPGKWQSVDGPDPVYTDRSTGYSPEGEFSRRGKNFIGVGKTTDRKNFNREVSKAEVSVKLLKNAGFDPKQAFDALSKGDGTQFHPVAIKLAIRKVFSLPGTPSDLNKDVGPEIDPSVFDSDDIEFVKE